PARDARVGPGRRLLRPLPRPPGALALLRRGAARRREPPGRGARPGARGVAGSGRVKARVLGLVLLAAAAALHVLVTVPRQQQAAADGDAYRGLRDQRRQVQSRLARIERADGLRRQAAAVFARGGTEDVVRDVRRAVIGTLEGTPVSNVWLAVRPGGRDQVAASVSL